MAALVEEHIGVDFFFNCRRTVVVALRETFFGSVAQDRCVLSNIMA